MPTLQRMVAAVRGGGAILCSSKKFKKYKVVIDILIKQYIYKLVCNMSICFCAAADV
jgi:hypothetical protein